MPKLSERIEIESLRFRIPKVPKRKLATGVGFVEGGVIVHLKERGNKESPVWLKADGLVELHCQELKTMSASYARGRQVSGCWRTPKFDERALTWFLQEDGSMAGRELHPKGWEKSYASGCGDGQIVGYGYKDFGNSPTKALLWPEASSSFVILDGPDPNYAAYASCVAQGIQGGYYGGRWVRACIWRGTSQSYLDLHPGSHEETSQIFGTCDGEQVGQFNTHAALWRGTVDSFINLHPDGFVRSYSGDCAGGFQVGWVASKENGGLSAYLWNGSSTDGLDLQRIVPAPWNESSIHAISIQEDRLLLAGQVQECIFSNGYDMLKDSSAAIWEIKLRPGGARLVAAPMPVFAAQSTEVHISLPEDDLAKKLSAFGDAIGSSIVDKDFKALHELLAPWLQKQLPAKKLKTVLKQALCGAPYPTGFSLTSNDTTLKELRDGSLESYGANCERGRTFQDVSEGGDYGPPSLPIPQEISEENFRGWMQLELTPEAGESDYDFVLQLYFIAVEVDGHLRAGYIDPEQ